MEHHNQRIMLTKRLLKEALLELLQKKPIEKVSISELCAKADINRATFYRHYNLPQDIIEEIGRDMIQDIHRRLPIPAFRGDTRSYLVKICHYFHDHAEVICTLIRNNSDRSFTHLLTDAFDELIRPEQLTFGGRVADDADLRLVCACLSGASSAMLRQWLIEEPQKTPEEIADLLFGIVHHVAERS